MSAAVPVIAIDGPAGAGKSTIAVLVARRLGYHLLVSGALYRALALLVLEQRLNAKDTRALTALVPAMRVEFELDAAAARVRLNGEDVTRELSGEDCAALASRIAGMPALRAALLKYQRGFRRLPGLVAEGRDMGTVVFPEAKPKVFLTAALEERARRRLKQLNDRGLSDNLAALCERLATRDERDKSRTVAPLKPADDAAMVDTTGKSINAVVKEIETLVVNHHHA